MGRDPAELPIMMEASRLWEDIDKEVQGRTGFKRQGVLYLSQTEAAQEKRESWLPTARKHGLDTKAVSKAELSKYLQHDTSTKDFWVGGVQTLSDAKAEPWQAVPAVAELAHSEGVIIRENCAVRAMELQAGQINSVVSEAGYIKTQQVVLAGGRLGHRCFCAVTGLTFLNFQY